MANFDTISIDLEDDLEGGSFTFDRTEDGAIVVAPTAYDSLYRTVERTNLWLKSRWLIFGIVLVGFLCRILVHHGFYIVAYAYGIYFLNLTLGFLSPLDDPELEVVTDEKDDYRPFVRRLPEFKYWFYSMQYLCLSALLTCFEFFNLPVFWPILVAYFLLLVFLTLKDRIKHMIQYGYVPWSGEKKKYGRKVNVTEDSEKECVI